MVNSITWIRRLLSMTFFARRIFQTQNGNAFAEYDGRSSKSWQTKTNTGLYLVWSPNFLAHKKNQKFPQTPLRGGNECGILCALTRDKVSCETTALWKLNDDVGKTCSYPSPTSGSSIDQTCFCGWTRDRGPSTRTMGQSFASQPLEETLIENLGSKANVSTISRLRCGAVG